MLTKAYPTGSFSAQFNLVRRYLYEKGLIKGVWFVYSFLDYTVHKTHNMLIRQTSALKLKPYFDNAFITAYYIRRGNVR